MKVPHQILAHTASSLENGRRVWLLAIILFVCLTSSAQEPVALDRTSAEFLLIESAESEADGESPRDDENPPVRRRIVDTSKFPPSGSGIGGLILAPFRVIGPRLNSGLTTIEEKNALERLRVILGNPHIHPLFGSLGDGSGFGGGVALSTADSWSKHVQAFGNFHGTFKKYLEIDGGLRLDPTGGNLEKFSLEIAARYRKRPEEDFWGLGPTSLNSNRSTYDLKEPGFSATVTYRASTKARFGVLADYTRARIGPGLDTDFPTTQDRFAGSPLPGLFSGADLLGYGVFAELDLRDVIGNPRSGFYARYGVTSYDSVGDEDFGFVNYRFDARGYLPLGNKRRVLALRMLGDFNNPKGGSEIPFFRLARLGDTQTLRGYDTYRFHGRHALMGTAEYRFALSGGVEAFAFTDVGQVFDFKSQFNTDNLRVTYGGGFRFATAQSLFLRIYAARGGERMRLFVSFGPSF